MRMKNQVIEVQNVSITISNLEWLACEEEAYILNTAEQIKMIDDDSSKKTV